MSSSRTGTDTDWIFLRANLIADLRGMSVPEKLNDIRYEVTSDGLHIFRLGSFHIEGDDDSQRQQGFEGGFKELIATLRSRGIDSEFIKQISGYLRFSFTLFANVSECGVVLTGDVLRQLASLGADVSVDTLES